MFHAKTKVHAEFVLLEDVSLVQLSIYIAINSLACPEGVYVSPDTTLFVKRMISL